MKTPELANTPITALWRLRQEAIARRDAACVGSDEADRARDRARRESPNDIARLERLCNAARKAEQAVYSAYDAVYRLNARILRAPVEAPCDLWVKAEAMEHELSRWSDQDHLEIEVLKAGFGSIRRYAAAPSRAARNHFSSHSLLAAE